MKRVRFFFPIRFKLLLTMLVFITAVVSVIVFTMANLFHKDKAAYMRGLTAEMAMHTATEARSLLDSYHRRLKIFSHVVLDVELFQEQKSVLIKHLYSEFPEFVCVSIYESDREIAIFYDGDAFSKNSATKTALHQHRLENPLAFESIAGRGLYIENSTFEADFPILTLAIAVEDPAGIRKAVIAAVVRSDELIRLIQRSKVFLGFIADHDGRALVHYDGAVRPLRKLDWIGSAGVLPNTRSTVITNEFTERGIALIGAVAQVGLADLLAGVQIPVSAANLTSRELLQRLGVIALLILILAAFLSLVWSHYLTRSIGMLSKAARHIGRGDFNAHVNITSRDEIGQLSDSFNRMASELNSREKALQETQSALIRSEKMAAFGQIGAGIAHEVKNPLAGILGLTQLCQRKAEKDSQLSQNLKIIEKETRRCKTIVDSLMKFARQEKMTLCEVDVKQVIMDTMTITAHQLSINRIEVQSDLGQSVPNVRGNANQLQQVLFNLLINAQQAMKDKPGTVKLSCGSPDGKQVVIRVCDTGPGIPPDYRAKIFEPFFTTKPVGEGTGLGLSVSYGIIKEHGGDICVSNEPRTGTEFVITLPGFQAEARAV